MFPGGLPFSKAVAQLDSTASCSVHRGQALLATTPDRFISRRRNSDVDASHFKLLRGRSGSLSGPSGSGPDSPSTPEERAYNKRMSRMSGGRSDGGVLGSSAGANAKEMFDSPTCQRALPHSPDGALQMEDIPDDIFTNIMAWSSKHEIAVALLRTVYIWNGVTGQHRNIPWDQASQTSSRTRSRALMPRARRGRVGTPVSHDRLQTDSDFSDSDNDDYSNDVAGSDFVVCSVAWHQDGRLLALGMEDGTVRVWDSLDPAHVPKIENREVACAHNNDTNALCWGLKNTIFSGHQCGCIQEVTLRKANKASLDTLLEATSPVSNITVSEHQRYLAASTVKELLIWQLPSRALYRRVVLQPEDVVKGIVFLPWLPDVLAYSTCRDEGKLSKITLWHVVSESVLTDVGTESQVCSLAANKFTHELISGHGGKDNAICLWTGTDLQLVGRLPGHNCRVLHMAVSPDGTKLASCAPDQVLKFWSCFDTAAIKAGAARRRGMSTADDLDPFTSKVPPKGPLLPGRVTARRSSMPTIQSPLLGKGIR